MMLKQALNNLLRLLAIGALSTNTIANTTNGSQQPYPDLIVTNAQVDKLCQITFTIKNIGEGAAPASIWTRDSKATLVIERNNKVWHTVHLHTVDPERNLAYPGSTIIYSTQLEAPTRRSEHITAIIDPKDQLLEASKQNNRQYFTVWCDKSSPPMEEQ